MAYVFIALIMLLVWCGPYLIDVSTKKLAERKAKSIAARQKSDEYIDFLFTGKTKEQRLDEQMDHLWDQQHQDTEAFIEELAQKLDMPEMVEIPKAELDKLLDSSTAVLAELKCKNNQINSLYRDLDALRTMLNLTAKPKSDDYKIRAKRISAKRGYYYDKEYY